MLLRKEVKCFTAEKTALLSKMMAKNKNIKYNYKTSENGEKCLHDSFPKHHL